MHDAFRCRVHSLSLPIRVSLESFIGVFIRLFILSLIGVFSFESLIETLYPSLSIRVSPLESFYLNPPLEFPLEFPLDPLHLNLFIEVIERRWKVAYWRIESSRLPRQLLPDPLIGKRLFSIANAPIGHSSGTLVLSIESKVLTLNRNV